MFKAIYQKTGATIHPEHKDTWLFKGSWSNGTNILGLDIFSITKGVAIAMCGEDGKPLLSFFESVSIVMMKVTTWIIHFAPIVVCFLPVTGQLLEMKDIAGDFVKLMWYFITVLIGLLLHGLVVLPILYSLTTRSLPFR
jgi:solute carrier family 1 (high affinity glutamate transporter) protein 3